MDTYQPKFDSSYWNLDALEMNKGIKVKGTIEKKVVRSDIKDVDRMIILPLAADNEHHILWLRPSTRAIEKLSLTSMDITTQCPWSAKESFLDIQMHQEWLYALVRSEQKYYIRRYPDRVIRYAILNESRPDEWPLETEKITPSSRLRVATFRGLGTRACVSLADNQEFLAIDLNTGETAHLLVRMEQNEVTLGAEIDFVIDSWKATLVIADFRNHRIVEVDYQSGVGSVLCGIGHPGNAAELSSASVAPLNFPSSVVVYRPHQLILQSLLTDQSSTFLTADSDQVKPRTIIVADSGNVRVKKIVELPFPVSEHLRLANEPFIYTLIGSGIESQRKTSKLTDTQRKDLREYSIPRPSKLLTTDTGELIIYSKSQRTFVVLKPASAEKQKVIVTRKKSIHDT